MKPKNKKKRLEFVMKKIIEVSPGIYQFKNNYNQVHLDEKKFALKKKRKKLRTRLGDPSPRADSTPI